MRHYYPITYGYPVDMVLAPMMALAVPILAYYRGAYFDYFYLTTG